MKKIMFNDRFGLTDAVLTGRKTMTRRLMPENIAKMVEAASKPTLIIHSLPDDFDAEKFAEEFSKFQGVVTYKEGSEVQQVQQCDPEQIKKNIIAHAQYKVGEVVAVAQNYDAVLTEWLSTTENHMSDKFSKFKNYQEQGKYGIWDKAGLNNKMFVRADVMPHRIRITDIKVERLQDISDEDCLREGIEVVYPYIDRNPNDKLKSYRFRDKKSKWGYYQLSPVRDCFAVLIDRVSGKGTWERNPWVFAYKFELIK